MKSIRMKRTKENVDEYFHMKTSNVNSQPPPSKTSTFQPSKNMFQKYDNKINLFKYEPNPRSHDNDRIMPDNHARAPAKQAVQVLDLRTKMILHKLFDVNKRGVIKEINGNISLSKKADVYHATSKDEKEYAVKIRSQTECKWAEKEMRNLKRMHKAQLSVPEPIIQLGHVLVTSFIGEEDGWPSPKLKDVEISQSTARSMYRDIVIMMWKMFNICKLVHADLSEFNLLYHRGNVVIIDLSRSVEHDQCHALNFLHKDCTNISDFFRKKGVATLTKTELFKFITDSTLNENNFEEYIERLFEKAASRNFDEMTAQEQVEDEAFKNIYVPKRLTKVTNERDVKNVKKSDTEKVISPSGSKEDDNGNESSNQFKNSARPKDESPNSKKLRKKAVKEKKAENRKNKTKKHVKKHRGKLSR